MSLREPLVTVFMVRPTLDGLPAHPLPSPFTLRPYRPGDEATWARIESLSDPHTAVTADLFEEQFGADEAELSARQRYLCDGDGAAVGTITAWHNDDYPGRRYGRVHWVAIVPSHQGRGLAKPLLASCLELMEELGCEGAYLTTEPPRIPAINLYLRFGFTPDVRSEDQRRAWQAILEQVKDEFRPAVEAVLEQYT